MDYRRAFLRVHVVLGMAWVGFIVFVVRVHETRLALGNWMRTKQQAAQ